MQVKLRGVLSAAIFAATLCGCYAGSREATSRGGHGGSYAAGENAPLRSSAGPYGPGIAALEAGKHGRARRAFDKLLAVVPQDADANYLAGLLRVADHDLKGALAFFGKAVTHNSAMIAAHQQRGVILAKLGRTDDAEATLALLESQATTCGNICADAADVKAAIAAIAAALGQDSPSLTGASPGPSLASTAAGSATTDPPLHDGRWLAPGTPITVLSREPGSCLAMPRDEKAARAVNIGRVAFRTPALLGGQAARLGLSCATCHRNGRTNPVFLFPGVSGKPGTADVTTSILSSHRGDGIFNPKPIPDLAGLERKRLISRDPASGKLEVFIYGVVVKEFDGPEPPIRVLEGLSAYVRAISPRACGHERQVSLATHLDDAGAAMDAAAYTWAEGDRATARLMIASARTVLGMMDERYAPGALTAHRRSLHGADLGLAAIQQAIGRGRADVPVRIIAWRLDMAEWAGMLKNNEARSLYDPAVLAGKKGHRLTQR